MNRADTDPSDLITVNTGGAKPRAAIVVLALVILIFAFVAVRWQIGNMLAVLTPAADANAPEIGDLATSWAPGDPAGYALIASAASPEAGVNAFEAAVRRAPNDFRWRIDLGRAYEQAERAADAEREFRIATDLAPNLSQPRWSLGNFLLRSKRIDQAFAELRIAAEKNELYRDEVFALIWDYSSKDASRLEALAADSPQLVARLAYFFAARGRAEDALRSWNRVPAEFRDSQMAKAIALGLFEKQHFRESLAFANDYGAERGTVAGSLTNPSFDEPLMGDGTLFAWSILRSDSRFDAAPDSRVRKDGARSLRATFKGSLKTGFANIFQTVVVEPGARYRLAGWVRTEDLRSAGLPFLDVINPATGARLGASKPFPAGDNDWTEVAADFTVPPEASGVTIRTVRVDCGEDCPITGIFWYDGFRLERL